jgi:hypothetical protein
MFLAVVEESCAESIESHLWDDLNDGQKSDDCSVPISC